MKAGSRLWAFLVRDFLQEVSYRTNFIMQIVGVLASLTVWYFLGSFFARFPQLAESLGGMDYFSYSVVGIAFLRYLSRLNSTFASKVRQEQMAGTLEAMLVTPNRTSVLVLMSSAYELVSSTLWILAWLLMGRMFGATFHLPAFLPIPHPSWRTRAWAAKRPWLERELVPALRARVAAILAGTER